MRHAGAARGRDHRPPDRRRHAGAQVESALDPGDQRAEDVRPAAERDRGPQRSRAIRRRGKLFVVDVEGDLSLLIHLMSAGRLQLFDTRASLRDRTSRLLLRLADGRELRLREFGTKQAAWVKLLTPEGAGGRGAHRHARPRGLARPAGVRRAARRAAAPARAAARPARDRRHRPLLGRRDPPRGEAVAVQARRRAVRRGGRSGCARRSSTSSAARSTTTRST